MQDTDGHARQETFLTISETARLPGAVKFGSQWRIDREVLMSWVRDHGRPADSDP